MSAPSKTPDKLTNKEKHNRESVKTLLKRDYNTVTEADLEESTEVIERSELDEPPEVPNMKELKAASLLHNVKAEKAQVGKVVDDDYVNLPDAEKVVEEEKK